MTGSSFLYCISCPGIYFIFNKINIDLFIKDVNYLELETKWTFIYSIDIYMYMSIHLLGAQTDSFFMITSFPYIV